MSAEPITLTPVQQADQVRQVVGVLRRIEQRFDAGCWSSGARFGPGGGTCLIGGIDEATGWAMPGVREEVTERLAEHLPQPFRAIAQLRPRLALALYNDTVGGRNGAGVLVRRALADLGISEQPRAVFERYVPTGDRSGQTA